MTPVCTRTSIAQISTMYVASATLNGYAQCLKVAMIVTDNQWVDDWANEYLAPLVEAQKAKMAKQLADQAETIVRYLKAQDYGDWSMERTDDYDSMKDWTGEDV